MFIRRDGFEMGFFRDPDPDPGIPGFPEGLFEKSRGFIIPGIWIFSQGIYGEKPPL